MVCLVCPDGISQCARRVAALIGQVMMRAVPRKVNIREKNEAAVSCVHWEDSVLLSNNTGNEYDDGARVGLQCQSCLNQVKWLQLWKS